MSNVISFVGRLGRDSELRHASGGTSVLSFNVANDTGFGDYKNTNWFSCVLFRKRASEKLCSMLRKGTLVFVVGELSIKKYSKKDGTEGYTNEININNIDILQYSGSSGSSDSYSNEKQEVVQENEENNSDDFDDDIPF